MCSTACVHKNPNNFPLSLVNQAEQGIYFDNMRFLTKERTEGCSVEIIMGTECEASN